jgi:hypothetical protein
LRASPALEHFVRCSKSPQGLVQRAKIILELVSGKSKGSVAREQKITKKTVAKWCKRWYKSCDKFIEIENNPEITRKELKEKEFMRKGMLAVWQHLSIEADTRRESGGWFSKNYYLVPYSRFSA